MKGPRRIVCLTEETTETLYLLGEQERIVGISAFTVRPECAKKEKPVVSQYIKADYEKIVGLAPDLVLAFSDLQAPLCAELIGRGLNVMCFNQRSVAEILEMIRALGRLVCAADKGEALAATLQGNLDRVREESSKLPARPRVFFEEWPDPIITGIRWVSELIEIAGGEDVFAELRGKGLAKDRTVTAEEVISRQPDMYLASWCGRKFRADTARGRAGFVNAAFTRDGRMFEIPSSTILQAGPASVSEGLLELQRAIALVASSMSRA